MPGAPVPVSQKRPPSWAFRAGQCLGFTENGVTNKKHPVSSSPVGENSLLRGRKRMAVVQSNRWATNRQITAQYNSGTQNIISERTTHQSLSWMGYCSRRPHRVHSYQLKTRRSDSSGHAITNTQQLRSGKTLPGPTNPGSC